MKRGQSLCHVNGLVKETYDFPPDGGYLPITGNNAFINWGIGSMRKNTPACECCRKHTSAYLDVRIGQVGGISGDQLENSVSGMRVSKAVLPGSFHRWGWGGPGSPSDSPIKLRIKIALGEDICFDRTFNPAFSADPGDVLKKGTTTGITPPSPKSNPTPTTVPPGYVPVGSGKPVEINGRRGRWYRPARGNGQPIFISE